MNKNDLKPHAIVLPSYCPVMVCMTKHIAEDVVKALGYKDARVIRATKKDIAYISGK